MKDPHGERAEDAVQNLCHLLFGPDFVLRSPGWIEQSGPKELTDVLVVVDDVAIIVQSKALAIDIADLYPKRLGRIQKRQEEAKRQLNTTLNAHTRGAHVRATNSLGIIFDLDWSCIKKKIGIVTLHVDDGLYGDPEFRFQYPQLVEEHRGIIVHTVLVNDLAQMASELSTPADVLRYLEAREKCMFSGKVMIGNELDFLAIYKSRYPYIEETLAESGSCLTIMPGIWEKYREDETGQIQQREHRLRNGTLIDRLIKELHTSVEYAANQLGITQQASALIYLKLIGKLGKLSRIERADIGDKLVAKHKKTKDSESGHFLYVSKYANTAYLFLLANERDREIRGGMLEFLCVQACHTVDCDELVGIATEGAQLRGSSFDALVMDVLDVRSKTKPESDIKAFDNPTYGTLGEWGPKKTK